MEWSDDIKDTWAKHNRYPTRPLEKDDIEAHFLKNAKGWGLSPNDLGAKYRVYGAEATIIGGKPKAQKYKVLVYWVASNGFSYISAIMPHSLTDRVDLAPTPEPEPQKYEALTLALAVLAKLEGI